jgi:hypothetical protein
MSLSDLRHHYTTERSVDERLRLLEMAATHLPAPEFLWYPVAQDALASDAIVLRRAALRLMAFAPRSWDLVLVTALTTADAELQRVAIAALATQARAVPALVEAFFTLGDLPGWLPESREVWLHARAMLTPADAIGPSAAEAAALKTQLSEALSVSQQLQQGLAAAEAERQHLQGQLTVLNAHLASLKASGGELEAALESERRGAKDIALRLERAIAAHDAEIAGYERERGDLEAMRRRHKSLMVGSVAMVALLVLIGGPVTWTLGSQLGAPAQVAMAAPPPAQDALKDAEEIGYRNALAGLAEHAGKLANDGHAYPAVGAWQAYSRLALTPTEAQLGVKQSEALLARFQKGDPAKDFQAGMPRVRTLSAVASPKPRAAAKAPQAIRAPRQTAATPRRQRTLQPAPSLKVSPPVLPTPAAPAIPEDVRAKF